MMVYVKLINQSEAQGAIAQARLLLADHDNWCNQICTKV